VAADPAALAGREAARVDPVVVQEDFPVKDQCAPVLISHRRAVNARRRPLDHALTSCRQKCALATAS